MDGKPKLLNKPDSRRKLRSHFPSLHPLAGLAVFCLSRRTAIDPGCVKTFWSRFYSQDWNENRAPTQISGLLMNQTLADFT